MSVPAVGQTVGSRTQNTTVSLTCEAEKVGISHGRIRSCTYPSLEMNGSISLCVLTHIEVQVRFLLSPLLANAPLFSRRALP
jgi:hypothetical protein